MLTPRARAERLAAARAERLAGARADRLDAVRARMRNRRWPVMPPGKRGEVLLLLGVAWILIGIGALIIPPLPGDLLFLRIPMPVRAALWWGTGLLALVYAWMPRNRDDSLGFLALYVMPLERAVSYLIAWIDFTIDGVGGYRYGWLSALFYAVFIGVVMVCAGWREPPPLLTFEAPEVKALVEPLLLLLDPEGPDADAEDSEDLEDKS